MASTSAKPRGGASTTVAGGELYRKPPERHLNLMSDPRVYRGNTYSRPVELTEIAFQTSGKEKSKFGESIGTAKKSTTSKAKGKTPIKDRKTTKQSKDDSKIVAVETADEQEDLYEVIQGEQLRRSDPPPGALPEYIPPPYGIDEATQIIETELFNFDYEVVPFVELIVGRTLEQSLQEMAEEDSLTEIRQRRDNYEHLRNAELAEIQRWEDTAERRAQERNRRNTQASVEEKKRKKVQKQTWANDQARLAMQSISTTSRVRWIQTQSSLFTNTTKNEVETIFFPWLNKQIGVLVDKKRVARSIARDIVAVAHQKANERLKKKRYEDEQHTSEENGRGALHQEDTRGKRFRRKWLPEVLEYLEEHEAIREEDDFSAALSSELKDNRKKEVENSGTAEDSGGEGGQASERSGDGNEES
ncbi:MAG: putative radial spoke protein 3 [Streblomastix strix]|uniref:Putative radial spoke protein 3 n=1 Tax=Streblomastix strix TaxID=222440 RepID=A0A5J4WYM2_9EUKA|nr:MAG: putative radial spoke protein 3 [Streblomastix strix]